MASKIKVDQLETADGSGTIALQNQLSGMTSASMPTGSVLQVVNLTKKERITLSNAATKLIETSLVTKGANSSIFVVIDIGISGTDTVSSDEDLALAAGYKTGSVSSTSSDYTSISTGNFSRQAISGLNGWYASDTHRGGGGYNKYWTETKTYNKKFTTSAAAGTTINVAQWAGTNGTYYIGGMKGSVSISDAGQELSITLMEIAG